MATQIRLLGPDDLAVIARITEDDADFDVADRGGTREAIDPAHVHAYLSDPTVLHWVAFDGDAILGFLHGQTVRKYSGRPMEMLLYEIGVRAHARRSGVGRALLEAMTAWMKERAMVEVWVLADNPGAVAFYAACGFERHDPEAAVYMLRELP